MSSSNTEAVLTHLKRIRPNDGWGVETHKSLVRLTRRNVAITDGFFLDVYLHQGIVVGILTGIQRTDGTVQAQKLVKADGTLVGNTVQLVSVSNYQNVRNCSKAGTPRQPAARRPGELSNEQNQDIVKYGILAVLVAVAIRLISASSSGLFILIFPILYLYLLSTCPPAESFDAKKELKRILRGHHLPESHPEKPKGFLEQTFARIQATVATELATLPGYGVRMEQFAGAVLLAIVYVPSVETTYYWVGAANQWYFVYGNARQTPHRS